MFEDVCLTCGKLLLDASQAYCSDDCQFLDTSSPSISSASSAISSPSLGYATGGEVPPLVPSALGSALATSPFRRYALSSSSASSTSWSILADDEDEDRNAAFALSGFGSNFHRSVDSFYDGNSKSANLIDHLNPSALSYARRPSGTNNHTTVPNPHGRKSSPHVPPIPRSAPLQSHLSTEDDGATSDFALSSRDESDGEYYSPKPATKPKRNRASLPAYFSLLQISGPSDQKRFSSTSSSTLSRPSPPTPKLHINGNGSHPSLSLSSTTIATPRGRRRLQEDARCGSRSENSSSPLPGRSRSPSRRGGRRHSSPEHLLYVTAFAECASVADIARGRPAGRRNCSPATKMIPDVPEPRGRIKIESDVAAPGFGFGRSGLLNRERTFGARPTRVL